MENKRFRIKEIPRNALMELPSNRLLVKKSSLYNENGPYYDYKGQEYFDHSGVIVYQFDGFKVESNQVYLIVKDENEITFRNLFSPEQIWRDFYYYIPYEKTDIPGGWALYPNGDSNFKFQIGIGENPCSEIPLDTNQRSSSRVTCDILPSTITSKKLKSNVIEAN